MHGTSSVLSVTTMTSSLPLPGVMSKTVNMPPKKLIVDNAEDEDKLVPDNGNEDRLKEASHHNYNTACGRREWHAFLPAEVPEGPLAPLPG